MSLTAVAQLKAVHAKMDRTLQVLGLRTLLCVLLMGCGGQSGLINVTVSPVERLCPPGKVFLNCAPCQLTCENVYWSAVCPRKCTSGCYCPQGLVEFGNRCIKPSQCPEPATSHPTEPYQPTTDPYQPTTDPYEPTTDPYEPTTDPYEPTTDPYEPTTDPYTTDPYRPTSYEHYPYVCDLNEDEYGRPYYGPFDEYYGPGQRYTTPQPDTRQYTPPPGTSRHGRQILTLPACITSNECKQRPHRCAGSGTQYDRCGRRCTCRNGYLVNCCRVRKEWRSMAQVDRCRYVRVVYTASTQQPWKSCYDELIRIHRDWFGSGIHGQTFFLPWHRWYILALENLLRLIDCTITVPYWDWSLEPQTWQNSIVWADRCGLGGNGNPGNNDHVSSGVFRRSNWQLTPSAGGRLQRRFNGDVPDCASVALIQRSGVAEFDSWHTFISSNLHDAVHCNIDGTMCSIDSANAPEFFLHHGFIDKLWADWQNKGLAFRHLAYYSQNTDSMPGAFGYSPRAVYDLDNQPGCVRVCIEPSARPCHINTTYTPVCPRDFACRDYSPLKLAGLIARPYPTVPARAHQVFNTSQQTRLISARFSELFTDYDQLQTVLQNNGYSSGTPISYRPPDGELQFERYILHTKYDTKCPPYYHP